MKTKPYADLFARVREKRPLVHHITNYVTVNDCANITLCAGGAPVMADAPEEAAEMAAIAGALVLNIGTLNEAQIRSMILAGRMANERGIPIILDPVGAGATRFRTDTAKRLLDELKIAVLKGNAGEIGVMAGVEAVVRGVDSHGLSGDPVMIAGGLARKLGLTVAVSGATDVVTDGKRSLLIDNGHPRMGSISGTGCMAASVTGVFCAVSDDPVAATAAAFAALGLAGERAAAAAHGPLSFKVAMFDELANLTPQDLADGARIRSP
ncbi:MULTISPECIES: hydroxyethylthiazole kinase [unclassified Methanoregula]|uniref:hydroxyethylthiazole kinase n=1 Tax=unclassified Methanoregula TaxID=2649730 RepID=UPI0009D28514|nr:MULTISPECIES: hydroxyethylthiazole kinase [unclassified Methanoregula]OPX64591.1 MAG: Hydroxyethylthiazole kinase [Methanoregula sp. PtaB.Bin085]OPY33344.1 MAG: Hydroxyethylthiazole kinase [Methanoregula sp. PtaU1.Bin006]